MKPFTEDELDEYQERAAIMQYDAGMPKQTAEQAAMRRVLSNRKRKEERCPRSTN